MAQKAWFWALLPISGLGALAAAWPLLRPSPDVQLRLTMSAPSYARGYVVNLSGRTVRGLRCSVSWSRPVFQNGLLTGSQKESSGLMWDLEPDDPRAPRMSPRSLPPLTLGGAPWGPRQPRQPGSFFYWAQNEPVETAMDLGPGESRTFVVVAPRASQFDAYAFTDADGREVLASVVAAPGDFGRLP